jgi:hypothetical protein
VNVIESPLRLRRLRAESRVLRRGSVGDLDGRSREARFLRDTERELLASIAEPTFAQRLLARRAARAALRLELLDEEAARGVSWSDHDLRTLHALQNGLRLLLRELGLKQHASTGKAAPSLTEVLADRKARR